MVQSGLKRYSGEEILKDMRLQIATAAWGPASMLPGRRELAKQYGVSTVTVGKAIDALVAEKMLRVDDRRGTFVAVPSGPAELPSAPHGLTVGVVGPLYLDHDSHSNQWFRQIVQAVEHEYSDEDRGSIFTNLVQNGITIPLAEAVELAIQSGIDGLVVIAIEHNPADIAAAIETTHRHGIPVVFITSTDIRLPVPHVSPDGFDAGYQAAQHIIRQGARRCSFFAPFHSWWTVERGNGIAAAWEQAGLDSKAVEKLPLDTTPWRKEQEPVEFGFTTASEAFASGWRPEAVICANDGLALGLFEAAEAVGLRPGKDFLAVGFDDIPEARNHHLTSLRVPWDAMGREACRLLNISLNRHNESLQVRLRWRLIPRASSRRAISLREPTGLPLMAGS